MAARRRPEMSSLLDDRKRDTVGVSKQRDFRKPAAVALALGIVAAFIYGVIYIAEALHGNHSLHPVRGLLLPLLAILMFVLLFPLVFYISFQDEFGDINPVMPSHYIFLLRRSLKAIKENNFKVEAKSL